MLLIDTKEGRGGGGGQATDGGEGEEVGVRNG